MACPKHKAAFFTLLQSRLPNRLHRQAHGAAALTMLLRRFEKKSYYTHFAQEFPCAAQFSSITQTHHSMVFTVISTLWPREIQPNFTAKETSLIRQPVAGMHYFLLSC